MRSDNVLHKIENSALRLLCQIGLVVWLSDSASAAAGDAARHLQKTYENIADLQADFVQTLRFADFETPSVWMGKVALRRERGKGKMRWDFQTPEVFQVFVDGETVLHYTPEHRQAVRSNLNANPAGAMAFRLLSGTGDITRDFDARATKEAHQVRFVPKDKTTGFLWIDVKVVPYPGISGVVIQRVILQEESGNLTTFVFNNLKVNKSIDTVFLTFVPPPGVEITPSP